MTSALHIGVLETGAVDGELRDNHGTIGDWFERYLMGDTPPARATLYQCYNDRYPAAVTDCDAYVITGSAASVRFTTANTFAESVCSSRSISCSSSSAHATPHWG